MIEFSGCGQENKFILEAHQGTLSEFLSNVVKNDQVRSNQTKNLELSLLEFGNCKEAESILVGSATDGLFYSLLSSGIREGGRIGVSAYSFHASASCIIRAGLIPVFIDVDKNGLMDLDAFEKIAETLDGAVIVQLFGSVVDEKRILSICSNFKIKFIEDAAQRHIYSKNLIKSEFCTSSVLSFDPFKIFSGIGTGGAVVTKNKNVAEKLTNLRYHGNRCDSQGYNSQISECSAWLIRKKIQNYFDWQEKRKNVAIEYNRVFSKFETKLRILVNNFNINEHSLHKYVIVFNTKLERDYIENQLLADGIKTMVHYRYILPNLPLFKNFVTSKFNFSKSQHLSEHSLSLPIHPFIKHEDLLKIIERLLFHLNNL